MPVDPFYLLRRSPAGWAALARVLHKPSKKRIACWLLRVSSARLEAMLQKGEVFIKSRVGVSGWGYNGQQVVVVIFQIAIGDPPFAESNIYEAIINECDESRLAVAPRRLRLLARARRPRYRAAQHLPTSANVCSCPPSDNPPTSSTVPLRPLRGHLELGYTLATHE